MQTAFAPALPPVLVDANQLELALLNLAVNARDAMPEGGRLTLSAQEETLAQSGSMAAGHYVRLAASARSAASPSAS